MLNPNNIGLLHRLTMERRNTISLGVGNQDAKSAETSEVALYVLGISDEGESRTNALTTIAKERGLWVFEHP